MTSMVAFKTKKKQIFADRIPNMYQCITELTKLSNVIHQCQTKKIVPPSNSDRERLGKALREEYFGTTS